MQQAAAVPNLTPLISTNNRGVGPCIQQLKKSFFHRLVILEVQVILGHVIEGPQPNEAVYLEELSFSKD